MELFEKEFKKLDPRIADSLKAELERALRASWHTARHRVKDPNLPVRQPHEVLAHIHSILDLVKSLDPKKIT